MGSIGEIEKRMAAKVANLPPVRSFAELSSAKRAIVVAMTGYTVEDIEANLAYQATQEAAAATAELCERTGNRRPRFCPSSA